MAAPGMTPRRGVLRLRRALARILRRGRERRPVSYADWFARNAPRASELLEQRRLADALEAQPAFDIVVVRRPGDDAAAAETRSSLAEQTYGRFTVHESSDGSAAALNRAAAQGDGDLLVFVDPGDRLAPHALFAIAARYVPTAGLLYSDEDVFRDSVHQRPFFKPAWSPDALLSHDFVGGVAAVRRDLFRAAGGFREMEGAERHDLLLRLLPRLDGVEHVPHVLLHRSEPRVDPSEGRRRAIADHVHRTLGEEYRVAGSGPPAIRFQPRTPAAVTIVIPTRDRADLLQACIESLDRNRCAAHAEVVVVDNASVEAATHDYLRKLEARRATKVLRYPHAFNWSKVNNFAARQSGGDYLLFLNNDIEALDPGWLDAMLAFASQPAIGAVGAQLLYPDGTIQHTGVVLGLTGYAGHALAGRRPEEPTPYGPPDMIRDCTAVTGACMMVRRSLFEELSGFDERFILCGSDLELCLRMRARGLRNVVTPHARLLHHESKTRGTDIPRSDFQRSFVAYEPYLRAGDPYYNPNLSLTAPSVELKDGPEDMLSYARSFL
ncbi:MAG: glycosyltransferase family 2 protein [Myxococcales bacterium]